MDYKSKYIRYKNAYEQSKKQNGGDATGPRMEDAPEKILETLLEHQTKIKMLHFQTEFLNTHTKSDEYLEKFNGNFDRFMEVAQGIYGRRLINNETNAVKMESDKTISKYLSDFANELGKVDAMFGNNNALNAVRDEMEADVQQLRYILTFK